MPGSKLVVGDIMKKNQTQFLPTNQLGSHWNTREHNPGNTIVEGGTQPVDRGGRGDRQFCWSV